MLYHVASGAYSAMMDRPSAKQAALDAIGLLKHKKHKPDLAKVTTVCEYGKGDTLYLSTSLLIEENGMAGEYGTQDSGNEKANGPEVA